MVVRNAHRAGDRGYHLPSGERSPMTRVLSIAFAVAAVTTAALAQVREAGAPGARTVRGGVAETARGPEQARKLLDTYCAGCHNARARAGGVAFDALTLDTPHDHADVWEKALRKLRGRQMPPPGNRQPDQREIDAFTSWMEATLDSPAGGPVAGHVPIQRLTRTEFATAVSDLLGIELDAEKLLPAEIEVQG